MERKGIAVVGTLLVDNLCEISSYPQEGELTKINSLKMSVGGLVPNNGIGLKKIAPDMPVYAVGVIGDDDAGAFAKQYMADAGVDVSHVLTLADEKTSFTHVMSVPGAQRTFFTYPGACAVFGSEHVDWDNLNCKMLHLGYFLLLDRVDGERARRSLKRQRSWGS